jgi:hypothetical protein
VSEIIRATNYANIETMEEGTPKMKGISYLLLGLTIFIAVSGAILTTDAIKWGAAMVVAKIIMEEANQKIQAELKINAQRQEAENKNRAIRDAEIARQQEKYQAEQRQIIEVNKKRMETCKFWIIEFNKSRSESDKNHRDVSCRAAGTPFN